MDLSVIVPVYNMSKYLAECLDSILAQQIEDMEIVCLNDGSADGSLSILKEYEKKDTRIRVIDKENSGYGDTLNKGIATAKGEYIAIVESDDAVVENAFQRLLQMAKETDADVIKGNYNYYIQGKTVYFNNLGCFKDGECIDPKEEVQLFFIAPSIWTALYKRSFLDREKIGFLPTPGASYQDTSFAFKVWACTHKAAILHIPVINYRSDNPTSSSNETGKPFQMLAEFEEISTFLHVRGKSTLFPVFSRVRYISGTWNAHRLVQEYKVLFLMKLREMFKEDHEKGYLVRKYWNDEDWRRVHTLVYNFREYCEETEQNRHVFESNLVIEALQDIHPLYICGTDRPSRTLRSFLKCCGLDIEAFVETDKLTELRTLDGKPVISPKQVKPEGIIVLENSQRKDCERETLASRGLYNYIDFEMILQTSDALRNAWHFLDAALPELQELRQNVENLQRYKKTAVKLMDTENGIAEWLSDNQITNVSIYGIGRLGKALLTKLENSGICVEMLVDRNQGEFHGTAIRNMAYFLENPGETQLMIITPIYEAEAIGKQISENCGVKWISIENILEECITQQDLLE